jgi:hypothetical protein
VTEGAVTAYEGDDPSCTPKVYTLELTLIPRGRPCFRPPQHPEYLSGYATNGSAMATVLTLLFGDKSDEPIVATSPTNPGFERHRARLSAMPCVIGISWRFHELET